MDEENLDGEKLVTFVFVVKNCKSIIDVSIIHQRFCINYGYVDDTVDTGLYSGYYAVFRLVAGCTHRTSV